MLVHMTPGEVQGLQTLAMRHGGSLTINPQTGLPEAGFLSSLLPMLAGAALTAVSGGTLSPMMAAMMVGGGAGIMTGSLKKGLMAGLGAYGGANLGGSLSAMGAEQATALGNAELAANTTGSASADLALNQNALTPMINPALPDFPTADPRLFADKLYSPATQKALARGPFENMFEGASKLGTKAGIKDLGGRLGYTGVGALAVPPLLGMMEQPKANLPGQNPVSFYRTKYNQAKYNPATGRYDIPGYYDPGSYGPTAYVKTGGRIGGEKPRNLRDIYGDEAGVGPRSDAAGKGSYSDEAGEGPYSNNDESTGLEAIFAKMNPTTLERYKRATNAAVQAAAFKEIYKRGRGVNPYMDDVATAAQGGLTSSDYAAGGKLLRGAGDGMSDSIPAVIRGPKPQRAALADGEFVIPADVVSHLGNGSTDAGAKRLYAMMDKVRHARTGNNKQGKQINPMKFMPA